MKHEKSGESNNIFDIGGKSGVNIPIPCFCLVYWEVGWVEWGPNSKTRCWDGWVKGMKV